ncbi:MULTISPECIES: ferredoxin reductase [Streptacidiphilus]|uniref:Ferredoxin reductase n=2 Tax=Streptacidiphilus TaxID=228398 RepID=A0ABV6UJ05_9ACTN|nr:ferredoxin reductase [Streptacidiphilus jeojiense]
MAAGWRVARLAGVHDETATARTLVLDVPGWPGHLAGQHVDLQLTAEDGYQAQRSYSLSAPARGDRIELTVQRVPDGEVSPYLTEVLTIGDPIEVRGPVGGWFVWRPADPAPVLLIAGGAGIVPLMAMVRTRRAEGSRTPFRLLYSLRTPADLYYAEELRRPPAGDAGADVTLLHTRSGPPGSSRIPARLNAEDVERHGWPPEFEPACYVCGPTGFVEAAADILTKLGHDPRRVRTERFGAGGG